MVIWRSLFSTWFLLVFLLFQAGCITSQKYHEIDPKEDQISLVLYDASNQNKMGVFATFVVSSSFKMEPDPIFIEYKNENKIPVTKKMYSFKYPANENRESKDLVFGKLHLFKEKTVVHVALEFAEKDQNILLHFPKFQVDSHDYSARVIPISFKKRLVLCPFNGVRCTPIHQIK